MPDLTPNNPDCNPNNNPHSNDGHNMDYELITVYVDNEIRDEQEKNTIKNLIESDNNYRNRFIFENLTKENFQKRYKRIETPFYIYKNVGNEIDEYIKRASKPKIVSQTIAPDIYSRELNRQKSNLRKYLMYGTYAFLILVVLAFVLNNYLKGTPELKENDLVAVSRNVFDKIGTGQVTLKHNSNNAKELSDTMNKYLDFQVFIPDVKEAVLQGGVCNEIHGEKVAHFVHKKGNIIIYTLEASMKHVMNNKERIILCDEFKESINEGKNWIPCLKDKNRTVVIWYRDNIICVSISELDPIEITSTLTNYK